jgi:hypothetical protein
MPTSIASPSLKKKIPFLMAFIARDNSQRFVPGYRGISSHGLIVYHHSAIHPAARNQILQQVRNIGLAIPPTVLSSRDPPATCSFILRANPHAQQSGAHHEHRQCRHSIDCSVPNLCSESHYDPPFRRASHLYMI